MKLSKEVTKNDVEEAHRLFQVSTMQAIKSSHVLGMHSGNNELVHKIEEAIKNRIEINTSITMARLIEELEMKYSNTEAIHTAINTLVRREDFDSIKEGKVLVRRK
jgi:DNA replication licensing factor MCM5